MGNRPFDYARLGMKIPNRIAGIEALEGRIAPATVGGIPLEFLDSKTGIEITGAMPGDYAGEVVTGIGDLNGDGFGDFAVAAPRAEANGVRSGSVFVLFGSADGGSNRDLSGLDGTRGFRIDGANANDYFGSSISGAGDVNGDGVDDLIIGARPVDPYASKQGLAYVIFGRGDGFAAHFNVADLDGEKGFRIVGGESGDRAGFAVGGAGDVNGDGIADFLIGAPGAERSQPQSGVVYLVFGKHSDFPALLTLSSLTADDGVELRGADDTQSLGLAVSRAGDVNGDGTDDVIVSGGGTALEFVIFGRPGGFGAPVDLGLLDGSNGFAVPNLGGSNGSHTVDDVGDVNGDGFDDILIGVANPTDAVASVIFGRANWPAMLTSSTLNGSDGLRFIASYSQSPDWRAIIDSFSGAGDINGDGFDDLVFGASFRIGKFRSDGAFVYTGHAGSYESLVDLTNLDDPHILRLAGPHTQANSAVGAAGDVNGDGIDDLIVGVPSFRSGDAVQPDGAAFVFFGIPTLSVASAQILEGSNGTSDLLFPVTIAGSGLDHAIDVTYVIKPRTAAYGSDFGGTLTGTLHFDAGVTEKNVRVPILGDSQFEADETFIVKIHTADSITVAGRKATGTIVNDDLADGAVAVLDLKPNEGFDIIDSKDGQYLSADARGVGDLNGDGLADYLVTAIGTHFVGAPRPVAYCIVFGTADGVPSPFDVATLDGTNGFQILFLDTFTRGLDSVAPIGDLNGDGIDDLAIGAPEVRSGSGDFSSIYVLFGSRDGFSSAVDVTTLDGSDGFRIDGAVPGDGLGYAVSTAGDFNGDGIGDLLAARRTGGAYVVFGREEGFPATFSVTSLDGGNGFHVISSKAPLGSSIGGGGDINGDGFDDIVIGRYLAPFAKEAAFVVFGRGTGFAPEFDVATLDGQSGFKIVTTVDRRAGTTVAIAGDINGDGVDDLLLGAYTRHLDTGDQLGKAYVVFGSKKGFSKNLNLATLDGSNGFALVGKSIDTTASPAGDINGDGFDDIAIFSPVSLSPLDQGGSGLVVFGKAGGFSPSAKLRQLTAADRLRFDAYPTTEFLGNIRGAGDVDGDGFDDIIVTSTTENHLVFGFSVGAVTSNKVSFRDFDGDEVIVKTSGGGLRIDDLTFSETEAGRVLERLDLTGKDELQGGSLKIKVKPGPTGDGKVMLGEIDATGLDLASVQVQGSFTRLLAGSGAGPEAGLGRLEAISIGTRDVLFPALTPEIRVAGHLGELTTQTQLRSMQAVSATTFGRIHIGSSLIDTNLYASGAVDPDTGAQIPAFEIVEAVRHIGSTSILAGYDAHGLPVNPDATIGKIKVGGPIVETNIVAGIADATFDGFGRNDTVIPGGDSSVVSRIAKVIAHAVRGSEPAGDHFGITAEEIGKVKIAGTKLSLTSEAKDDVLIDAINNDLRVVEV